MRYDVRLRRYALAATESHARYAIRLRQMVLQLQRRRARCPA